MRPGRRKAVLDAEAEAPTAAASPDSVEDRREQTRILTVYRVARLNIDSDTGLCRVKNISDSGMMLVTSLEIAVGETVMIALSDKIVLAGEVSWVDGARVGVQFLEAIDAATVLQSIATAAPAEHRPIRLPTDTVAVAMTQRGTRAVRIVDISQQGMKISHDGGFTLGMQLKITLPNGLERRAVVRWANENLAGLKLLDPIAYQDLESAGRL
jgi:hypothetical protein